MHANDYLLLAHAQKRLQKVPALRSAFKTFPISGAVNANPRNSRWAGIYPGIADYEPKNVGGRWQRVTNVKILLQMVASKDGLKMEAEMAGYVNAVLTELVPRANWADLIELVEGFSVDPGFRDTADRGGVMFRESVVTVRLMAFSNT